MPTNNAGTTVWSKYWRIGALCLESFFSLLALFSEVVTFFMKKSTLVRLTAVRFWQPVNAEDYNNKRLSGTHTWDSETLDSEGASTVGATGVVGTCPFVVSVGDKMKKCNNYQWLRSKRQSLTSITTTTRFCMLTRRWHDAWDEIYSFPLEYLIVRRCFLACRYWTT